MHIFRLDESAGFTLRGSSLFNKTHQYQVQSIQTTLILGDQ